ncbi:HNH endonuclease signature motif containing protein [Pseudonocardia phyllosphaerae]|uniref:HNH endonuclease signature motif containing protein n=1 Tax=Pseudonocardia phyllosphaerae TaxID=3390502 RepID=UPI00397A9645
MIRRPNGSARNNSLFVERSKKCARQLLIKHLFEYTRVMPSDRLANAHRLLTEAMSTLAAAAGPGADAADRLSVLTLCAGVRRQADQLTVSTLADLDREGAFADRGYRSADAALSDLLGVDRRDAKRFTRAAEHVHRRTDATGATLPPALPATAEQFAEGRIGLAHVDVIATAMSSHAAQRVPAEALAAAERQIAEHAACFTPNELRSFAVGLIDELDENGPDPDDEPAPDLNTLQVVANRSGAGGRITGRYDDAAMFDAVATAIDSLSAPRGEADERSPQQRQAEALHEICSTALERDELPETGGRRPVVSVLIRLEDLERRAAGALLHFGGQCTPESLRMLACDAAVVPVVMNGKGEPLDVGRAQRTIPTGMRRAVTARDKGCAHPGCDRPPSWCDIHHIVPWEMNGPTEISNLVMLCKAHHRLIHKPGWLVRIRDGLPEFIPPAWIDADRRPRRQPNLLVPDTGRIPVPEPRMGEKATVPG